MAAARRRWADMIDTEDETEGAEDDSQLRKDVAAFVDEFMGPSAGSRLLTLALLQADLQRRCVGWTFPCRGWRWCVYEAPLTLLAEISVFVSLVGQTLPSERACNRRFRKMLSRWQSRLRLAALDCQHARAPSAPCQQCKAVKPFDYFADAQWDKARANLPATCLTCIHKDGGACKRKLPSNVERLRCIGCGFEKVEHAFPRAQLRQPRAEERRNCIACLKNVSELTCSQCAEVKPLKEFHLSALTLPWAAACQSCQDAVRGKARRLRAGWEKCRGCAAFLPTSSAVYINQRCPNCAADRKRGERTCLRCKRKWSENSAEEQIRKRFCPNCR
ncbi:unnamed protein product [Effrenium voratum]|uniref:Stc1 domain-containing protein n=1 Tax=Effrenium voratum TaxID=2562239 RepID=A0AA36HUZ7_9DINO|nr:unnamed protein product [Effrenium voratum]